MTQERASLGEISGALPALRDDLVREYGASVPTAAIEEAARQALAPRDDRARASDRRRRHPRGMVAPPVDGPDEWRMWDHERKWKPDAAEFSIETPSPDKHELDLYIGEAARQTLNEEGLLEPAGT